MDAEIIAVGTELLMGQVVNTNATFLSQELNALGFNVYYHSVVGDNPQRLTDVLNLAVKRSRLIVLTGGLGPTEDDLTKQTVAEFLALPLVENAEGLAKITRYFERSQRKMTPNNRLQALTIQGGHVLQNPTGLAVGTLITQGDTSYLLLPGPPSELTGMFSQVARPLLRQLLPQSQQLYSEVLRFYGIGESQLVTELADLIHEQTNPTVAPYAKLHEVTLRITGQSTAEKSGAALVAATRKEILARVGEFYYGSGDERTLAATVVAKLKEKGKSITAAESLTAGLFQSTLGDVSGVSEVFPGGFVTYSPQVKTALGVPEATIAQHGVVSKEVACAMAEAAREKLATDLAVSFTGVAGPNELEGHSAGTTWIALAQKGQPTQAYLYHFNRDRSYIREHAVMQGLWLVWQSLK
ncbi:competence/damage-inducible protein A [Enterococcus nangangensis]|uniref:competence/damage-inducible protein A n=1 Tax=Enterococcus nangangensis TaxID=2559926 RepID=UPI0010F81909|nr:competence/damage-inducible protein A [Enterococcus nangangensis]